MGIASKANGEALEAALDVYHGHLATQGRAWVRRVGVPIKVLGRPTVGARGRWYFRACFDGHQGVDFIGHNDAGRAVVLEAKSHAGPKPGSPASARAATRWPRAHSGILSGSSS